MISSVGIKFTSEPTLVEDFRVGRLFEATINLLLKLQEVFTIFPANAPEESGTKFDD